MIPTRLRAELDDLLRDLDLVVFYLEQPPRQDLEEERRRLRNEVDRLRERLDDVLREL